MKYGLSDETRASMDAVFLKHPKIDKVILYGSRAKGTHHDGSDIDLTLVGDRLELADLYAVDEALDELNLPYTIDLSLYGHIDNEGLIGHIERRGEVFYQKINDQFVQTKLSKCCQIKPPKSEAKKILADKDLVSFAPMKNLGIDTKYLLLDSTRKLSEVSGSYTYFAENDVLLAKITPCFENGKLGIARELKNGIGFGSSEFIVFRTEKELLPEYLYYFLLRPSFRDDGKKVMTGAVGHKRVPKDYIENTEIPLPPINEQKRIVAILDQAFAEIDKARANAQQNLNNSRELFESYLQQVFSQRGERYKQITLSEITECISDGDHSAPPKSPEGIPFITISNINKSTNVIDFSNTLKVPEDYYAALKETRKPQVGDVLYTVTGSYGIPVIVRDKKQFCFQRHIGLIRPNKEVDSQWLYYLLMSPQVFNQADRGATGTAQKTVSLTLLRNILVPNIPLDFQRKMVGNLDTIYKQSKKLEDIYSAKIESLDELKKSILQKAFTGELTKKKVA